MSMVNNASVPIIILIIGLVAGAIIRIVYNKRHNKGGCGSCDDCSNPICKQKNDEKR